MQIGILGTGSVGGNLGQAFAAAGHRVKFGSRSPDSDKVQRLVASIGEQASAGTNEEALAFGELVVIALPWSVVEKTLPGLGDWSGKIVVDATNRLIPGQPDQSAAEIVAGLVPGAAVVKAFNTIGAEHFVDPIIDGQAVSMFICSDDAQAKSTVGELVTALGFDLVDAGPLANARLLESLAELWIYLMRSGAGRNIGFKLLRG